MTRTFTSAPAKREAVPLLVGLVGPSSSGKTYSALRLATGIQRQRGGEVYVIDTEARRAAHYADTFAFRHVPFGEPFGPLDYLAAIEHCVSGGATVIVIDSMSHEHEGPGGVLEMHAAETTRLAKAWRCSEDAAKMSGWQKPKSERRRLINTIIQLGVSCIFCYRAKPKMLIKQGQKPKELGFMPIGAEEMIYEMTVNALLLPGADGVPSWHPDEMGEKAIVKCPRQFRELFSDGRQLDEAHGEELARWAAGEKRPETTVPPLLASLELCHTKEDVEAWATAHEHELAALPAAEKRRMRAAYKEHRELAIKGDKLRAEAQQDEHNELIAAGYILNEKGEYIRPTEAP